jgi:hypothetical protein
MTYRLDPTLHSRPRCAYCGKRGRLIRIGGTDRHPIESHVECFSVSDRRDEARDAELAAAFSRVEEGE